MYKNTDAMYIKPRQKLEIAITAYSFVDNDSLCSPDVASIANWTSVTSVMEKEINFNVVC